LSPSDLFFLFIGSKLSRFNLPGRNCRQLGSIYTPSSYPGLLFFQPQKSHRTFCLQVCSLPLTGFPTEERTRRCPRTCGSFLFRSACRWTNNLFPRAEKIHDLYPALHSLYSLLVTAGRSLSPPQVLPGMKKRIIFFIRFPCWLFLPRPHLKIKPSPHPSSFVPSWSPFLNL